MSAGHLSIGPSQYWYLNYLQIRPVEEDNLHQLYSLPTGIGKAECQLAVEIITQAFPALRSQFRRESDTWRHSQFLSKAVEMFFSSHCPAHEDIIRYSTELSITLKSSINVENGPLAIFNFIDIGDSDQSYLMIVINHLISDYLTIKIIGDILGRIFKGYNVSGNCRFDTHLATLSDHICINEDEFSRHWLDQPWELAGELTIPSSNSNVDLGRWFNKRGCVRNFYVVANILASEWGVDLATVLNTILSKTLVPFLDGDFVSISNWENGRGFNRDMSSVGLYSYFWPMLINADSSWSAISESIKENRSNSIEKSSFLYLAYGPLKSRKRFDGFKDSHIRVNYLGAFPIGNGSVTTALKSTPLTIKKHTVTRNVKYTTVEFVFRGDDLYMEWDFPSFFHNENDIYRVHQSFFEHCRNLAQKAGVNDVNLE